MTAASGNRARISSAEQSQTGPRCRAASEAGSASSSRIVPARRRIAGAPASSVTVSMSPSTSRKVLPDAPTATRTRSTTTRAIPPAPSALDRLAVTSCSNPSRRAVSSARSRARPISSSRSRAALMSVTSAQTPGPRPSSSETGK